MNWIINCLVAFMVLSILGAIYNVYLGLRGDEEKINNSAFVKKRNSLSEIFRRLSVSSAAAREGNSKQYKELREMVANLEDETKD